MKPRAISSMRALSFALLAVASGDCGGGRGLAGTVDSGSGGTAGKRDAAGDGAVSDVARDASQDRSSIAADTAGDVTVDTVDAAGDARGDGSVTVDGILCPLPTQALITDFTYVPGDGGTTTAVHFGKGNGLSGTEYVYPIAGVWPLTSDVTGNNWHISGAVGDRSGFGLNFDGCNRLDASAYRGISFTISGSVALGSTIRMGVTTVNDAIAAAWLNTHGEPDAISPGRCIPSSLAPNQFAQTDCADPSVIIPVTATPTVRNVLWSDFSGGEPEAAVSPADILAVYWSFPPPPGVGTANPSAYPVDITIDNLAFVP